MPPAGAPPITDAFGAIAHPVRRSLVTALAGGDKPVRELAAVVHGQPARRLPAPRGAPRTSAS